MRNHANLILYAFEKIPSLLLFRVILLRKRQEFGGPYFGVNNAEARGAQVSCESIDSQWHKFPSRVKYVRNMDSPGRWSGTRSGFGNTSGSWAGGTPAARNAPRSASGAPRIAHRCNFVVHNYFSPSSSANAFIDEILKLLLPSESDISMFLCVNGKADRKQHVSRWRKSQDDRVWTVNRKLLSDRCVSPKRVTCVRKYRSRLRSEHNAKKY